jgi:hypothetical protein
LQELGKAKVCNMSFKTGVKKDVVRFHITVNNQWGAIMMKVAKALCSLNSNLIPGIPVQMTSFLAMKNLS